MIKSTRTLQLVAGFTLLEVLVAMVVLSFGLLGMAGLQGTSLRNNTMAYQRSQATILGFEIMESMRANRDVAQSGSYNIALSASPPSITGSGAAKVATEDLSAWFSRLGSSLPNGDGAISCDANNVCQVTVQWDAPGAGTQQFIVSTEL